MYSCRPRGRSGPCVPTTPAPRPPHLTRPSAGASSPARAWAGPPVPTCPPPTKTEIAPTPWSLELLSGAPAIFRPNAHQRPQKICPQSARARALLWAWRSPFGGYNITAPNGDPRAHGPCPHCRGEGEGGLGWVVPAVSLRTYTTYTHTHEPEAGLLAA